MDILRDRIVLPQGKITVPVARAALTRLEQDLTQAKALAKGGACETIFIDGGSQLTDIITLVTLDEASNPNKTFRYAERNAYIRNLFNDLNECGLNVVWTSKARDVWVADKKVPNLYQPDCHADIPFMVDVNIQLLTEPSPEGLVFYGVFGTNAFSPALVGKRIRNLEWGTMLVLLGVAPLETADGTARIHGTAAADSDVGPITTLLPPRIGGRVDLHQPFTTPKADHGDFGEVQR